MPSYLTGGHAPFLDLGSERRPDFGGFWLFGILHGILVVAFAVLVIVVLILLIRYLLAATRAARLYVETHRETPPSAVEAPPATKAAPRTRKPPGT